MARPYRIERTGTGLAAKKAVERSTHVHPPTRADREIPGQLERAQEGRPERPSEVGSPFRPIETAVHEPATRLPTRGHVHPASGELLLSAGREEVVGRPGGDPSALLDRPGERDPRGPRQMVVAGPRDLEVRTRSRASRTRRFGPAPLATDVRARPLEYLEEAAQRLGVSRVDAMPAPRLDANEAGPPKSSEEERRRRRSQAQLGRHLAHRRGGPSKEVQRPDPARVRHRLGHRRDPVGGRRSGVTARFGGHRHFHDSKHIDVAL